MATAVKRKSTKKTKASKDTAQIRSRKKLASVDALDIQKKAYELFEQRGGTHGSDLADWLEAEKILLG